MIFSRRKKSPPHIWVRLLSSFLFFVGGAVLVLWSQGLRFDPESGTLKSTGALSLSMLSSGEAFVFLDGRVLGEANDIFLGLDLGEHHLCVRQNLFRDWCRPLFLPEKKVAIIQKVALLPRTLFLRPLGNTENMKWDDETETFQRFFSETKTTVVFSQMGVRVFEGEEIPKPLLSSPPRRLSFSADTLFLKREKIMPITFSHDFSEDITDAFFLRDSDSFIGVLSNKILFFADYLSTPVLIASQNAGSPVLFSEKYNTLFWQKDNQFFSLALGEDDIFSGL